MSFQGFKDELGFGNYSQECEDAIAAGKASRWPKAPDRASTLPKDAAGRKGFPVASGVLDYFPDALVAIAEVSKKGNDQHNPGQPLHWAREKSTDEADTMIRHFLERGTRDTDGLRHSAKMAWRALALLQKEIEASADSPEPLSTVWALSPYSPFASGGKANGR